MSPRNSRQPLPIFLFLLFSALLPGLSAAATGDRLQTLDLRGTAQCRWGTSLAAVPGSLVGSPTIPALLVVSCGYEDFGRLTYVNPSNGEVVKQVTTSLAPPVGWGSLAFRADEGDLTGCTNGGSGTLPNGIYSIDPNTGATTLLFQLPAPSIYTCNSHTWDATDQTFFTNTFPGTTIHHWSETGVLLGSFSTPFPGSIFPCDSNGLAVGGDVLYVVCDDPYRFFRMDKRTGAVLGTFPGIGDYLTDPECDPLTFAHRGLGAIWARRPLYNQLIAFEVPGDCGLGGLPVPREIQVDVDIRPGSCPNPVNCRSGGVLPVAILGDADLDAAWIDPSTVRLAGVAPLRSSLEDVAGSSSQMGGPSCAEDCAVEGPDGLPDLTFKFDTQQVLRALGPLRGGSCLVLTLTGRLRADLGGTPIQGQDAVRIQCAGKQGGKL